MTFEQVVAPSLAILDGGGEDWYKNLAITFRKLVETEQKTPGTREEKLQTARDRFYKGDIADELEAFYIKNGGFISKTDLSAQSFYAIKDGDVPLTRSDLADRTINDCPVAPEPVKGWFVDLEMPGERVSSPALVTGGLVFFLTFVPSLDDPCSVGGTTYLYYREFDTGCVPNQTVFGEDPDPEGEERPVGRILIGAGYAAEMFYYAKTEEMLIQTSDRTVHSRKVSLPRGGIENYAWREVFY